MRLKGKAAIVTGAGQGIGRAIALALAREGACVAAADIDLEKAERVAAEAKMVGAEAVAIKSDVSRIAEIDSMIGETVQAFGEAHILVNNVSGELIGPSIELTETMWSMVMDSGVKATFFCCQRFARQVMKQASSGRAKIVNIASVGGHVGTPNYAVYGASKAGILQLTRALGVEWIRYNINVNAVSPGVTLTPRVEQATKEHPEFFKPYFNRIPAGRPGTPEYIANGVLFLVSPEADHIVGHALVVDGGVLALHPGYVWPEPVGDINSGAG